MSVAIATFIFVALTVGGLSAAIVAWPSLRRRARIRRRLATLRTGASERDRLVPDLTRNEPPISNINAVARALSAAGPIVASVRRAITTAGLRISAATFVLASLFTGVLGAMIAQVASGAPSLALVAWAAGTTMPWLALRHAQRRRMTRLEAQVPEALDVIARALRAGHTLPSSVAMAAEETPEPLGSEFRVLFEQQTYGPSFADALRAFGERVAVVEARLFITAVLTQREVGGNLAEVLDGLAAVTRDRLALRRQVRTLTAHGRLTGWILASAAPALAVGMFLLNPEHPQVLLDDPIGLRMLAGAAVLQVAGALLVRRIVNVEY